MLEIQNNLWESSPLFLLNFFLAYDTLYKCVKHLLLLALEHLVVSVENPLG